jgi:hypothetical protein
VRAVQIVLGLTLHGASCGPLRKMKQPPSGYDRSAR